MGMYAEMVTTTFEMKKYGNVAGNSGISKFEMGDEWIRVRFSKDIIYTYSYKIAGPDHVEKMKELAGKGSGLATYINRFVKDLYDQ